MTNEVIGKLLAKRARMHSVKSSMIDDPKSKRIHIDRTATSVDTQENGFNDCVELCSLLLEKTGADVKKTDVSMLDQALTDAYSPRVVELLTKIAGALDKNGIFDGDSDITESSDDDEMIPMKHVDAVVPSATRENRHHQVVTKKTDALVPAAVVPRSHEFKKQSRSKDAVVPMGSNWEQVRNTKKVSLPTKNSISPTALVPNNESAPVYKNETEIAISRIFDLGKVASVQDPSIKADAPYDGPSVITMTGFGELGRFGNQVLQYMFMQCYAKKYNISEIQVPSWVGAALFGLTDRPVQRAFPSVVEFRGTVANSTFTTDFIDYVKRSNGNRVVPELYPSMLADNENARFENVDIWGWFQWHTSYVAPYKKLIQETFKPVPTISAHLESAFDKNVRYIGGKKRTVVGLHLRLGDYKNIAASSFGYCAPTEWYLNWLAEIWPTLENPVLFVASDDVESVLRDFKDYSPITADSAGITLPAEMKTLKAGFFPDWWCLTQCDVLAISNSTFSFSACMMNTRTNAQFFRAHYSGTMVEIDPWNADPIVHRDMNKAGISSALETLQVVYRTQGSRGLAKNLLYELPYYGLRSAIMKAVLWRQANNNSEAQIVQV